MANNGAGFASDSQLKQMSRGRFHARVLIVFYSASVLNLDPVAVWGGSMISFFQYWCTSLSLKGIACNCGKCAYCLLIKVTQEDSYHSSLDISRNKGKWLIWQIFTIPSHPGVSDTAVLSQVTAVTETHKLSEICELLDSALCCLPPPPLLCFHVLGDWLGFQQGSELGLKCPFAK